MKLKLINLVLFIIILLFSVSACNPKQEEKLVVDYGKTITFDYASGFDNGTLFDTSLEVAAREAGIYRPDRFYEPTSLVFNAGSLILGLEEALFGLEEGDTRNVRIPPEKAYGIKIENSTRILQKRAFDNPENLRVDEVVIIATQEGDRIPVYIKKIDGENITIDLNHPLAGEFIQFSIILRTIE